MKDAFISVSYDNTIKIHIGDNWTAFPLSQEGCRLAAEFLVSEKVYEWNCSSSVDHVDEYEEIFDRNVSDVIVEEMEKICA